MQNPDQNLRKIAPLLVLTAACVVAGVLGYVIVDPASSQDRVYLRNGGGAVLFTHGPHAEREGGCVVCHHDLVGEIVTECAECHDDSYDAGLLEHAELLEIPDHECGGCHEIGDAESVVSCRYCHPASAGSDERPPLCSGCHDESYDEPGLVSHAELLAIEDHTCSGCHTIGTASKVYHAQCNACHAMRNSERFVNSDGDTRCEACHLK